MFSYLVRSASTPTETLDRASWDESRVKRAANGQFGSVARTPVYKDDRSGHVHVVTRTTTSKAGRTRTAIHGVYASLEHADEAARRIEAKHGVGAASTTSHKIANAAHHISITSSRVQNHDGTFSRKIHAVSRSHKAIHGKTPKAKTTRHQVAGRLEPMRKPAPGRAQSLVGFIKAQGGVKDQGGNLKAAGLDKRHKGLVRPGGHALDRMREMAAEAGYLGAHVDRAMAETDVNDLLGAIAQHPVYSVHDLARVQEAEARAAGRSPAYQHRMDFDGLAPMPDAFHGLPAGFSFDSETAQEGRERKGMADFRFTIRSAVGALTLDRAAFDESKVKRDKGRFAKKAGVPKTGESDPPKTRTTKEKTSAKDKTLKVTISETRPARKNAPKTQTPTVPEASVTRSLAENHGVSAYKGKEGSARHASYEAHLRKIDAAHASGNADLRDKLKKAAERLSVPAARKKTPDPVVQPVAEVAKPTKPTKAMKPPKAPKAPKAEPAPKSILDPIVAPKFRGIDHEAKWLSEQQAVVLDARREARRASQDHEREIRHHLESADAAVNTDAYKAANDARIDALGKDYVRQYGKDGVHAVKTMADSIADVAEHISGPDRFLADVLAKHVGHIPVVQITRATEKRISSVWHLAVKGAGGFAGYAKGARVNSTIRASGFQTHEYVKSAEGAHTVMVGSSRETVAQKSYAETLLHEGVHNWTQELVQYDDRFKRDLSSVMDDVRKHFNGLSPREQDKYHPEVYNDVHQPYGLSNHDEFLANGFSNTHRFRELLAETPLSDESVRRLGLDKPEDEDSGWNGFKASAQQSMGRADKRMTGIDAIAAIGRAIEGNAYNNEVGQAKRVYSEGLSSRLTPEHAEAIRKGETERAKNLRAYHEKRASNPVHAAYEKLDARNRKIEQRYGEMQRGSYDGKGSGAVYDHAPLAYVIRTARRR